jgi:tetratricopeptide (TPR) repeat protein
VFESDGGEFVLKEGSYQEQKPAAEPSRYSDELSRLERETGDALARLDEAPDSKERQEEFLRVFEKIYNYDSDETIALETGGAFWKAHHRVHAYALAGNKTFLKALMASTLGPYGVGLEVVSERIHDEMLWKILESDARLTLDALSELPPETRERLVKGVYTRPIHDGFDFAAILKKLSEAEVPDGMRQDVEKIRDVVGPLAEMMAKVEKVRENFEKGKAAAALGPSGYEEAVREFQKVIEAVPEWPEPYDELGMVYLKQGRNAEAVTSLKKYLELNPLTHPRVLNQIRLFILKLEEETEEKP